MGFGVEYLGVVEAEDLLVVGVDLLHAGEGEEEIIIDLDIIK